MGPPLTLCCHKSGTTFGRTTMTVIKAHVPSLCNHRATRGFTHKVTTTNCIIIDNVTHNVSATSRHNTLTTRKQAVKILNKTLSHFCPGRGVPLTQRVIRGNKVIVDRCPFNQDTSGRAFPVQGHVIDNVDRKALIMRTTLGDNSLVATNLTLRRNEAIVTIPKHVSMPSTRNYGGLVGSNTTLIVDMSSILSRLSLLDFKSRVIGTSGRAGTRGDITVPGGTMPSPGPGLGPRRRAVLGSVSSRRVLVSSLVEGSKVSTKEMGTLLVAVRLGHLMRVLPNN